MACQVLGVWNIVVHDAATATSDSDAKSTRDIHKALVRTCASRGAAGKLRMTIEAGVRTLPG